MERIYLKGGVRIDNVILDEKADIERPDFNFKRVSETWGVNNIDFTVDLGWLLGHIGKRAKVIFVEGDSLGDAITAVEIAIFDGRKQIDNRRFTLSVQISNERESLSP